MSAGAARRRVLGGRGLDGLPGFGPRLRRLLVLGPVKPRDLGRPVAVSLEGLVPRDRFCRYLAARLGLSVVRGWGRGCYPDRGGPSIDPAVVFTLYPALCFEGVRSERQRLALAADRLGVRWHLGYGPDGAPPDAAGFTRIRQRLGLAVLRRFFGHGVDPCQDAGLVRGKEVFADATRVPGNASADALVPRLSEVVDGHLVALFGSDTAPDDADEAGEAARDTPERRDLLEECRLDQARPPSGPSRRLSDRKVSRTDPDAAAMSMRDGRTVLGYQDHDLVDGGKARVILHCPVTPGDALEEQGVRAYMPLPERDKSSPYYHNAAFTHDAEQDVYRCPQGQALKLEWVDEAGERAIYRARAASRNACPVKRECPKSTQGRLIGRSFHAEYLDRVRGDRGTAADEKALRKRNVWVEPLFAEAKQWHGLGRFRLRGPANVNGEALLAATGQHLKRWRQSTGWGRRGPPGAAAAVGTAAHLAP
jgi:transposase